MTKKERQKALDAITRQQEINGLKSELSRARSVTVGTAFGGTTEISMRSSDGNNIWCLMQPVEVLELIHQLAANVGCHIAIRPREDFGSWREWRISESEKKHLNGWPPFANDMAVFHQLGCSNFDQKRAEEAVLRNLGIKAETANNEAIQSSKSKELKNGKTLATKKIVNRRSVKSTPRAS